MCSHKILNGGTTTKSSRIPWKTSVICFFYLILVMKLASCEEMPSIKKFFHLKNNDLTKVTWCNRIQNEQSLQSALKGICMMIESDVFLRARGRGKNKIRIPTIALNAIDARPPSDTNNPMTLNELLEKVADAKSVGVKLDFDKITVFRESIKVLQAMRGKIKFPLWLNANTDHMKDKDIDDFLSLCTHNFPKATISIGMLHKGQKTGPKIRYNAKLVTQMKDTLNRNNVTQTVAFPVRFINAAYSVDTLSALKDVQGITDSALFIFTYDLVYYNDGAISNINKLIKIFGKDHVYLDYINKLM